MVSMLILSDEFGDLPVRASQSKNLLQDGVFIASTTILLEAYGAPRHWRWVMWHGVFINLTIVCCHLWRRSRLHLTLDRVSMHNNSSSSIRVDSRHERYTNYTACRWPIRPSSITASTAVVFFKVFKTLQTILFATRICLSYTPFEYETLNTYLVHRLVLDSSHDPNTHLITLSYNDDVLVSNSSQSRFLRIRVPGYDTLKRKLLHFDRFGLGFTVAYVPVIKSRSISVFDTSLLDSHAAQTSRKAALRAQTASRNLTLARRTLEPAAAQCRGFCGWWALPS